MADTKISGFTADTSPSTEDLIVTVNDPSGTPANKKVTIANLLTFYDEEFIPCGYFLDGTALPGIRETITSTNKIEVRKFDDATDEDVQIPWQVPYDIVAATGIFFQVVSLVTESTGPSNEGWAFFLQGASIGSGDILSATLGTAVISSATTRTDSQYDIVYTTLSSKVTITNLAAGEMCLLKLYRDVSDAADTYAQDVGVVGIVIKYQRTLSYS